jgi:hypothetical protein
MTPCSRSARVRLNFLLRPASETDAGNYSYVKKRTTAGDTALMPDYHRPFVEVSRLTCCFMVRAMLADMLRFPTFKP